MGGVVAAGLALGVGAAAWAVRGRASSVFAPSVWRGATDRRSIALSFDDGPSESTPRVLELLDQSNARATFFQIGAHVDRLPAIAAAVSAAGHEPGNHGYTHRMLIRGGADAEIDRAQRVLTSVHGAPPRLFRAPYGVRWFGLAAAQRRHGLLGVMWSAIALDWKIPPEAIVDRLLRAARPGAIFCLHDGRALAASPDISATTRALAKLLPELTRRGYRFETVSEILCPTNSRSA